MTKSEIKDWIIRDFQPVSLATPSQVIDQQIDNAARYWNTHSAYKVVRMYDLTSQDAIQLDKEIKTVVRCYPSTLEANVLSAHPMWSLLGLLTLDRYTHDIMLLQHTFGGYNIYIGNDFRWKFIRSESRDEGGWLYLQHVPKIADKLAVVGLKRLFIAEDDIQDEFILDWILQYSKALVKVIEGNTLRKAQIVGIANDGEELLQEGKEEVEKLQKKLKQESMWAMLARRR